MNVDLLFSDLDKGTTEVDNHNKEECKYQPSTIPKGYQWCKDCCGLTRHVPHERSYNGPKCEICGDYNYNGEGCTNCGWWDDNVVDGPGHQDVVLHQEGCHFHPNWMINEVSEDAVGFIPAHMSYAVDTASSFFRNNFYDEFYGYYAGPKTCHPGTALRRAYHDAMKEDNCGCPSSRIIYNINTWGHWSSQDYWGEWSGGCTIRCPICGQVFDYEW